MRNALENGSAGLEFDVHLTRDDHLLLHHDPDVRVDGNTLTIADTDLRVLRASKPDLATLPEVLTAFAAVPLTVEVKAPRAAEAVARALALEENRLMIVSAFTTGTVARIRRTAPLLDTSPGWTTNFWFWLLSRLWRSPPVAKGHVALQVPLRMDQIPVVKRVPIVRRRRFADRRLVEAAHRRGLAVHLWTLNEVADIHDALDLGADGVITDVPSVLTAILRETGTDWSP